MIQVLPVESCASSTHNGIHVDESYELAHAIVEAQDPNQCQSTVPVISNFGLKCSFAKLPPQVADALERSRRILVDPEGKIVPLGSGRSKPY
ncbi:unnamed protein product [Cylicostephanus goldi]|uniref:Uncharacterized protein n=1 Tax=Cylicostephanus goldi TaxID=71465 RepID=A0A3P6SYN7_CYLGO|nr:unnamed protein product [Cylicostephanus goldi]